MANLRGSDYPRQAKSMFKKLISFNIGRVGKDTHYTHSNALALKRQSYINQYVSFANQQGFTEKLNLTMTDENLNMFFKKILDEKELSNVTKINTLRGFSSMLQGLEEKNIDIPCSRDIFDKRVSELQSQPKAEIKTGRAIKNVDELIDKLYVEKYEVGVLSEIQNTLGIRISEAFAVCSNINTLYNEDTASIQGLIGKGNHRYTDIPLEPLLLAKIRLIENLPSQNTYRNYLKEYNIISHDFRYTFIAREYTSQIAKGVFEKTVLKNISEMTNHRRIQIVNRYLLRC